MTLRALIVDDEPPGRARIRSLLRTEADVEIVGEADDVASAVEAIRRLQPSLVFLDVRMPDGDGFDVVREVGVGEMPATVFVTAHGDHALRAFEAAALDYLLKPVDPERFASSVARARAQGARATAPIAAERLESLLKQLTKSHKDWIVVTSDGRSILVRPEDIEWIEAKGNYVLLHLAKETHSMRETLQTLESQLDPQRFVRVHRSAIVNMGSIKHVDRWFRGEFVVVLRDGTRLTTSRGAGQRLRELLRGAG